MCWYQLYDFHTFYTNVKNVHEQSIKETTTYMAPMEMELKPKLEIKTCFEDDEERETIYTNDDVIENIDEEEEDEPLLAVMAVNDCLPSDSIMFAAGPKRKRGRPRKNDIALKAPKGKRGRPRKYSVQQNDMLAPKIVQPPGIKRGRGRPCKVRYNEALNPMTVTCNNELVFNAAEEKFQNVSCQIVETKQEVFAKDLPLHFNENNNEPKTSKPIKYKKLKIHANMKKRKRNQQHKALMKNYIATSVRCMEFLKK